MKKIVLLFFCIVSFLEGRSREYSIDSVKSYRYLDNKSYIQSDFLLPAYTLVSNYFFKRQSYIYNITIGNRILIDYGKRSKSLQITFYNYTEQIYTYGVNVFAGIKNIKRNEFFITPEIKFFFSKKYYNQGCYISSGVGAGRYKYYEDKILTGKSNAWNVLASIGYLTMISKHFF